MDLEMRHLKLVIALSASRSMVEAAEKLRLTQSALSHQLRDLEEKLGLPVFQRQGRRLQLTSTGESLLNLSQKTLNELSVGIKEIQNQHKKIPPSIRVSTECHTFYHWLAPVLKAYDLKNPSMKVNIQTKYTKNPIAALKDGKLDLAVVMSDVSKSHFHVQELFSDELQIFVSSHHPLAKQKNVTLKDLEGATLVIYNIPDKDSTLINDILKPAKVKPGQVIRMELTEGIIELVKSGVGVGLLAGWVIDPLIKTGEVVPLKIGSKKHQRTWKLVTTKALAEKSHIQDFMTQMRTQIHA